MNGAEAYRKEVKNGKTGSSKNSESFFKRPNKKTTAFDYKTLHKNGVSHGARKAAHFLMLLGKEEAAEILKNMTPTEVESISGELVKPLRMSKEEKQALLDEFGFIARTRPKPKGGPEAARAMLEHAFGTEKGAAIFEKAAGDIGKGRFSFLEDLEIPQMKLLFKNESPAVLSIIVSCTSASCAARILKVLDASRQNEVVLRMGKMGKIEKEIIYRLEEALEEKIRKQGKIVSTEIDGKAALADILRHMDLDIEHEILSALDDDPDGLGDQIRERLFTIDMLVLINDRDLQNVLKEFSDREIALILKGKEEKIRKKMLENVSTRRAEFIIDEYRQLGPQKKSDTEKAVKDFLNYLKTLESEGTLSIHRENEEFV